MKEITTYIADDGTIFNDKEACASYEKIQLEKKTDCGSIYDNLGRKLALSETGLCDASYLVIKNVDQYNNFMNLVKGWGASNPYEDCPPCDGHKQIFYFSDEYGEWVDLLEAIRRIRDLLTTIGENGEL
jgi:hypothetical protein